jgi:hypothetical protein
MSFWDVHSGWYLIALALFPRATLLFTNPVFGGLYWWTGWLVLPRLLVALFLSATYWPNDPVLCILAWIWGLLIETAEKDVLLSYRGYVRQWLFSLNAR